MKIKILFVKPVFNMLNFFFFHPTEEFYEKKVADSTKVSLGACNKHMKKLAEIGFLYREKRGKMNFYRLNRENGIVKQLKVIFTLSSPIVNKIRRRLKGEEVEIFLYGSFARGEDVEDSDLDILLIGKRENHARIASKLAKIGEGHGKIVKVSSFTREEWLSMRKEDPAFYERVERNRIKLI